MPQTTDLARQVIDTADRSWRDIVAKYQRSDARRSIWQIINSVVPYLALWYLMYRSLEISYWLTLALALPAGIFLVRTFIIFHDCGHGSFFKSKRANEIVGNLTGFLTFTPYYHWRHEHAKHHASAGDLDRRGMGDVWTLTVNEYEHMKPFNRLVYRFYRFPLVMFGLGPLFMFMIVHRLWVKGSAARERNNVLATNAALVALWVVMHLLIGIDKYILVQLPIMVIGGAMGVWLFFIQHNFEGIYWESHDKWDFTKAALLGSSYYKLPKVLQWCTGNIGIHHVHHLSPKVPNYYLQNCQDESDLFQKVKPLTLRDSLRSVGLDLYDEKLRRLLSFREARLLYEH